MFICMYMPTVPDTVGNQSMAFPIIIIIIINILLLFNGHYY